MGLNELGQIQRMETVDADEKNPANRKGRRVVLPRYIYWDSDGNIQQACNQRPKFPNLHFESLFPFTLTRSPSVQTESPVPSWLWTSAHLPTPRSSRWHQRYQYSMGSVAERSS